MNKQEIFLSKVDKATRIAITTHIFPDADGIGSEISLCMALNSLGKNALCINEEKLLERYKYMDPKDVVFGLEEYQDHPDWQKIDLLIVVDTNSTKRTGQGMHQFSQRAADILFIDHHPCSDDIKKDHCIDTTAAATGELVGRYIKAMGVPFSQELALPIYTSILIDTSSFRYPSVTGDTHRLIGELLDTGIEAPLAYNGVYGTKKVQHMHLLSKILETANSNQSGKIAWIILYKSVLEGFGTDIEDTHGFVNNLLILDNIKVACMFREDANEIKVSFRSTGDYDVGHIARSLGGGGHSHSAATIITKRPGESLEKIVQETIAQIEEKMGNDFR